jgi:hypothetical protein
MSAFPLRQANLLVPIPFGERQGFVKPLAQASGYLPFENNTELQYCGFVNPYTNITPMTNFGQSKYLTPLRPLPAGLTGRCIGDSLLDTPVASFY